MRTVNAAVIGSGFIGPAHVEALRRVPGVRVVALASKERERAGEIAGQFGIARVYDRWEDAIADPDVEVIHNCTPNALHFQINKAAVLAGKHVVSEKPLTLTGAESAELLKLVKKTGVVNAVNFNYRFYPLIQHARGLVRAGDLGAPYLVHGHYLQDWLFYDTDYNWRLEPKAAGASRAIADIGSHWCDLMQFITGRKIIKVCASLVTVHPKRTRPSADVETFKGKEKAPEGATTSVTVKTEDAGVIMFELEGGAKGVVTVSQVSAGRKNREWFEIDGSKLAIAWNQEEPNQLWIGHRDRPNETLIKDPSLLNADARAFAHYPGGHPEGFPDGIKNMFRQIYDFIRSGQDPRTAEPGFPTFADGHVENRVVEAVLKSNHKQQWVNVQA